MMKELNYKNMPHIIKMLKPVTRNIIIIRRVAVYTITLPISVERNTDGSAIVPPRKPTPPNDVACK